MGGTEINLKGKSSSQNKRKRRRTGKKMRLRVYKLCIIFSYKKNRDIFISLCVKSIGTPWFFLKYRFYHSLVYTNDSNISNSNWTNEK